MTAFMDKHEQEVADLRAKLDAAEYGAAGMRVALSWYAKGGLDRGQRAMEALRESAGIDALEEHEALKAQLDVVTREREQLIEFGDKLLAGKRAALADLLTLQGAYGRVVEALIEEIRCEECRGTGGVTHDSGPEECGGCEGTGEFCRSAKSKPALSPPAPASPLTPTEVDALPDGTAVKITWSGGNGPHHYRTIRRNGEVHVDHPMSSGDSAIKFVGAKQPRTQVWLDAPASVVGEAVREITAQRFHETYERLAPSFGYETRRESAKPWAEVPEQNRRLMEAVVGEIVAPLLRTLGLGGGER